MIRAASPEKIAETLSHELPPEGMTIDFEVSMKAKEKAGSKRVAR